MAIQFLCPHCSATITVPNSSHGKRGTCPACKEKLIVPRPPGEPPAPQPAFAAAPEAPVVPMAAVDPAASVPAAVTPTPLVPEAPKSVAASISRKRRKRKSNPAFTVGIPIVCFGAFVAVMAAIFWTSQPELKGTISGAILADFDLPTSNLSLANLKLDLSEADTVATEFDLEPERFISAMMKCSVGIDGRQLTVKVVPNTGYEWFTVNPGSDTNLQDWVRKNSEVWDQQRKVKMQKVAAELCRGKLKRAAGERVVFDAARFRDNFALATQVKGFGYLVEAIGQSQRAVCAHEDANGTLYFALPADTKSFVLQGRSFDQQPPVFPGVYTVNVSLKPADPPPSSSGSSDVSPSGDEDGVSDGSSAADGGMSTDSGPTEAESQSSDSGMSADGMSDQTMMNGT